ncbi:MAG: isoleucine--tRNA ligase [Alphaproteobacteria bacterium]
MNKPVQPAAEKSPFADTLRLPKTDFPMRAGLPVQEPQWVKRWLDEDVYGKLRAKRVAEKAPKYIVHLGPPYANGNFHMGHALTYVLKDLIVRSKFMAGFDSPYAPGWDCHGLPIEWKIETELRDNKQTKHDISLKDLRARCRAYADKWIAVQKAEWQRLGAIGDWDRPYKTMDKANEAGIVAELGKMVQRGMVYRGLRSTLWSWAEETALAEAEVEYKDVVSTAVYVALPLLNNDFGNWPGQSHLVIWTTTPWTLPANRAVALKADEDYTGIEVDGKGIYWVAKDLAESFCTAVGIPFKTTENLPAKALIGQRVVHPLYEGVSGPVVEGFHVTTDSGTGLVHIAPAHGQEDFQIGQQFGLDVTCPVMGDGRYVHALPDLPITKVQLAGKLIWKAQKEILAELEATGKLLKAYDYPHSYPISWRSKKELIFRTTHQWFVDLDGAKVPETGKSIRESSLDCIYATSGNRGVNWVPATGQNRIGEMIKHRPDWCISRQRAWGVPITIFEVPGEKFENVNGIINGIITDKDVWNRVVTFVSQEGIDAWNDRIEQGRLTEFFPDGWLQSRGIQVNDLIPVTDILDVWFDSGTTHAHVLRADGAEGQRFHRADGKRPADLYQEGSDQHRGWFHSAMLTSVANYGDAPYENVVTSGFVVDGEGRKFSKSLGNGVEPSQLWDKLGMDIVRLWVSASDYSEDIRYSPTIMDGMSEAYRRFRNTFRWLLGNLNGWDKQPVAYADLPELEQYMLHRLADVLTKVRGHMDAYQFHKAYRELYEFCGGDLSNFYFDVRKDVLYCDPLSSKERRGCLTVLDIILRALVTHLAPILSFTCDEVWRNYGNKDSVHLETFVNVEVVSSADFEMRWEEIRNARNEINIGLEKLRAEGKIGSNLDAKVILPSNYRNISAYSNLGTIREALNVSDVIVGDTDSLIVTKHEGHKCPRCWRYYDVLKTDVCARCDDALTEAKAG